jgi:predicted metal-dependent HD superfamily phosphohydrolase
MKDERRKVTDARWIETLPPGWSEGCRPGLFAAAREMYASAGRHYHTWSHILDCTAKLRDFTCNAPRAVFLALLFHDAVYVAGRNDNEERSAELARGLLAAHATLADDEVTVVERYILATRSHAPPSDAPYDLRVTVDIDMSILASPAAEYDEYAANVRLEWCPAVLDDDSFKTGRAAFLRGLLASEAIFHTPQGEQRWEAAARGNIERELKALAVLQHQSPC